MLDLNKLAFAAVSYDAGDPRRAQHFLKVWSFARLIAQAEGLDARTQTIVEAAALLHDIGIHEAERVHGSSSGKWQELEGPAVARPLLRNAGSDEAQTERVCWLIAHHHSYGAGDDADLRILFEADFLVNAYEDGLDEAACRAARERIFRTKAGLRLLDDLFLAPPYSPAR